MQIHIALYRWKPEVKEEQITTALAAIESLQGQIPGILEIATGINTSPYNEGFSHVILIRGDDQTAIDAYRIHPGHQAAAALIETIEADGVGVDFETK